jgi:hypothetical protein
MNRKSENKAWNAGFTASSFEHTKQRENPEYPITRTVPERYRLNADYNEMLISRTGGDGDARRVEIHIDLPRGGFDLVCFTNVPMERVHAAIALLNDEPVDTPPGPCGDFHCSLRANHPGPHICGVDGCAVNPRPTFPEPPEPGHIRTEDFTMDELFPPGSHLKESLYMCNECGSLTHWSFIAKHVAWHNKTLP